MKTTRTPNTPTFVARGGNDHQALMLLAGIYGGHQDTTRFAPYMGAARSILTSPHAFDEGADTLSIEGCVLGADVWQHWTPEVGQLLRRILDERADDTPITAEAKELRAVIYALISETSMFGAAVMYELMQGGAR